MSFVVYKEPPTNCDWAVEYVVLEFWSGAMGSGDFKCVVCTTYSQEMAEEIVNEDELRRTWVKAFRLFPRED
jgi:hypothetical protein